MATLKTRKIINSLTAKGFMPQNGDHKYLLFFVNGKKTRIKTKVSHGEDKQQHKGLTGLKADSKSQVLPQYLRSAQGA